MKEYKQCKRCIMDNSSDEMIYFDDEGNCNYCNYALKIKDTKYFPNEIGQQKFDDLVARLKKENEDKEYDCIMGISGGLDSSYLAYLGAQKGLRILGVHIDDGFDTEIAKDNIHRLCQKSNIKLITIAPDAEQFNDLTKSFIRANVPNLAIPQDNILFATLFQFAKKNNVRHFLSGSNYALECIIQRGTSYNAYDTAHIRDIHRRFGKKSIDRLEMISAFQKDMEQLFLKIETLTPLDYIDYNKKRAIKELEEYCGFQYYGSKHLENTLTKFIQIYWFTNKFGVDKRKSHLSSLIISGQMTREEALDEMKKPLYDEVEMQHEIDCLLEKLDLSRSEFDQIMNSKPKMHSEYNTSLYMRTRNKIAVLKRRV